MLMTCWLGIMLLSENKKENIPLSCECLLGPLVENFDHFKSRQRAACGESVLGDD